MKRRILIVTLVIVFILAGWLALRAERDSGRTLIQTVVYVCDGGTIISAACYGGDPALDPKPGEPPVPTGSVDISLGGAASTTLHQTLSASGIRYANDDESFVFWSKGESAFIMRGGEMDPAYANCTARTDR